MNNQLFATVALAETLAGNPIGEVVDNISSHLGKDSSDSCLHLQTLTRIHVSFDGKFSLFCRRKEFFQYPAVFDAHFTQELFNILGLDMEEYRCSDVILKSKGEVSFKSVGTGFRTEWKVFLDNTCIGKIEEIGSFYDRSSEIKLDIPSSSSSRSGE